MGSGKCGITSFTLTPHSHFFQRRLPCERKGRGHSLTDVLRRDVRALAREYEIVVQLRNARLELLFACENALGKLLADALHIRIKPV